MSLILALSGYSIIVFYYHVLSSINMFAGLESTKRDGRIAPIPLSREGSNILPLKKQGLNRGSGSPWGPLSREEPGGWDLPLPVMEQYPCPGPPRHARCGWALQGQVWPTLGNCGSGRGLALEMRQMLVNHRLQALAVELMFEGEKNKRTQ